MSQHSGFDDKSFRRALGHFATGVTVVTSCIDKEQKVGVTANSFNSVSLDPPLVLWSLHKASGSLAIYEKSDYFIVNVLADDQIELSNRFSRQGADDKFDGIELSTGIEGLPLLPNCAAYFQCEKKFTYEGGDHLIFVGEVRDFSATDKTGLIYHQGQYAVSGRHPTMFSEQDEFSKNSFVEGYLDYLLSQVAGGFEKQFQAALDKYQVSRFEWRILSCLSEFAGIDYNKLSTLTIITEDVLTPVVAKMQEKSWLQITENESNNIELYITAAGLERLIPLMANAKAHEADVMLGFSSAESQQLKALLNALLRKVNQPLCIVTESSRRSLPD